MKNRLFAFLQNKFLYIFAFSVILFSACKKSDVPATPTSGLMAFNLIPDSATGPVVFALSGRSITNTPLSFTNYTGNYLSILSGTRELQLYSAANPNSALATTSFSAEDKKYYSAFAIGANGTYKNLVTDDNLDSIPSSTGNAFVRYINAIPDSSQPAVTITANGTDVVKKDVPFGTVSDFTGITPGDITVNVSNDSTISANRTITLEKDKVYTMLIMGMPKTTDTAKAVQIKYIINGTITPTP